MGEPHMTSYDEVIYPAYPILYTHPDRLATVASLFGMKPAPVEQCRVLEIGCSDGANLMAMAVGLPQCQFVGVDAAGTAIARGRALAAEVGLKNLTLRHLDLLEMAPDYGEFDYIIAHGVYSWVPEPVRQQILAICKGSLAPRGIAYVSYNAFPGCHSRVMLREMMLYHNRDFQDPQQKMREALTLLKLLAHSLVKPPPYSKFLQEEYERISKISPEGLYHDELGEVFAPCYFHEFMEQAGRHDLQFLGEAGFFDMVPRGLTPSATEVIARISNDVILKEQYLDFMCGRYFRRTLLCHPDVPLNRDVKPDCVRSRYVSTLARPESAAPSSEPGAQDTFESGTGAKLATPDPLARALLWYLHEREPERIAFGRLVTEVEARARRHFGFVPKPDQDVVSDLTEFVWTAYSAGVLDLHSFCPPFVVEVSDKPLASPLARLQARHSDVVSTLDHRSLKFGNCIHQGFVTLLDGSRDRAALRADLMHMFESGKLTLHDEGGKLVDDMQIVSKTIDEQLDRALQTFARGGLLMG